MHDHGHGTEHRAWTLHAACTQGGGVPSLATRCRLLLGRSGWIEDVNTVAINTLLAGSVMFGALGLFLLTPSAYRLLLEFPARVVVKYSKMLIRESASEGEMCHITAGMAMHACTPAPARVKSAGGGGRRTAQLLKGTRLRACTHAWPFHQRARAHVHTQRPLPAACPVGNGMACCITCLSWSAGFSRGTEDTLHVKVMQPGLHASENHVLGAWLVRHPLLGRAFRARKRLLYAMATVHTADGQLRRLQVAVITCVALAISMSVWSPDSEQVCAAPQQHATLLLVAIAARSALHARCCCIAASVLGPL